MKRLSFLASLMIATLALTSCGKKKTVTKKTVDPAKPGNTSFVLTQASTCSAIDKAYEGQTLSAEKFGKATAIDIKKVSDKMKQYASTLYKDNAGDDYSDQNTITYKIFSITNNKVVQNYILATAGSSVEEKHEFILAEDAKGNISNFKAAFRKSHECFEPVFSERTLLTSKLAELVAQEKIQTTALEAAKKALDEAASDKKEEAQKKVDEAEKALKTTQDEIVKTKAAIQKIDDAAKK